MRLVDAGPRLEHGAQRAVAAPTGEDAVDCPAQLHVTGAERPRERLLRRGAAALNERELLALVLRHGRRGESALDIASALIAEYGGLAGIATARPEELAGYPGVGPAKAAALVAAFQLGRIASETIDAPILRTAGDAATVAMRELAGTRRERVIVMVCDSRNRLLRVVPVAEGSVDRAPVPVREILNAVLRHDGRAFAVAHNHPSGDPEPSDTDLAASEELRTAARTVGLRFLDHVVVGGGEWRSAVRARR